MNQACLTFIHALSPLHAGTGQGVGVIDLPIAREKATNLPFLPGSTLKGTLRDECGNDALRDKIFGTGGDATASSGSAIFSDQRLLCLPVRSLFGTFAWVTAPYVLSRFQRDCENIGQKLALTVPTLTNEKCAVAQGSPIAPQNQVILEDLDLQITDQKSATDWAKALSLKIFDADNWRKYFQERFCVVSDNVFNFLMETATEITARNVLKDETKTSANLWYEEALPTETILSGLLVTVQVKAKAEEVFQTVGDLCRRPVQLGGNMTVGRGLCRIIVDAQGGAKRAHS